MTITTSAMKYLWESLAKGSIWYLFIGIHFSQNHTLLAVSLLIMDVSGRALSMYRSHAIYESLKLPIDTWNVLMASLMKHGLKYETEILQIARRNFRIEEGIDSPRDAETKE